MKPRHFTQVLFPMAAMAACAVMTVSARESAHLLGPTGMMGSDSKNQIKVTKVDEGSPADGEIKVGDVITGANGKAFQSNPRHELAAAINEAETHAANGRLTLELKGGDEARLELKVYGSYSDTAPYDCEKTNALVEEVAAHMVGSKEYLKDRMGVSWLGLMATGDKDLLSLVKRELPRQAWANPDLKDLMSVVHGESDAGLVGWYWGYQLLTLSEYHLLTGDMSVLPAIEAYAVALSKGQDPAGIWGHRMTSPKRNGRLPGYSHINQPSLSCFIGLLLAQGCGLENPDVDRAVQKTYAFYRNFVGKGTIPYGVHDPRNGFNNNGMSAMSGIAMSFLKDHEGAKFFSRQTATSYNGLESGHASHFFNVMWSPLGAHVAGPEVTKEFSKRSRWLYTLYRAWDGRFSYDGGKDRGGSSNGALLLNYCLPRKQLFITGKHADESNWLKAGAVAAVMDQSQIDFKSLSVAGLIGLFDHPGPSVRRSAVWELRNRSGDFTPRLTALLEDGNTEQKTSALEFFGYRCPQELALPQLELMGQIMNDTQLDPELRAKAASAICWLGPAAYGHFDDMLRLVLEDKPGDEFGLLDKGIAKSLVSLCPDPFRAGLVKDKDLFYGAVLKLAENKRQEGRGAAMTLLKSMPLEDFPRVGDQVKHVVLNRDRSYHSYHNPQSTVQPAGELLAALQIKEGLEWALRTLKTPDGKASFKNRAVMSVLSAYGVHSESAIEAIKKDPELLRALTGSKTKKQWDRLLQAIEDKDAASSPLISFEEANKASAK